LPAPIVPVMISNDSIAHMIVEQARWLA
jgi:hypothetical protein